MTLTQYQNTLAAMKQTWIDMRNEAIEEGHVNLRHEAEGHIKSLSDAIHMSQRIERV